MVSLPLGAVRLQQEFLHGDPPAKEDVARLKQYIERELRLAVRKLGSPRVGLVIATSGTAAALAEASVAMARKLATRKAAPKSFVRIKPSVAKTAEVRRLAERLAKMNNGQRASIPGIGPRRSEIVVGGAMVYASLLERMGLRGFRYSPLGLRDGTLAQMLADADLRASVHKKIENERWAGVLEVCRRYGVDMKKAEPVRQHVAQLYDDLARVHELPPEYRLWLEAAAMMQDVGKYMNHQGHHRHTQYIVANSEIFGFSPEQRAVVSAIARYMGKSRPGPVGPDSADDCDRGASAYSAGGGAAAAGSGAEPGPRQRGGADADARLSETSAAGAGAGARGSGAGGVVAAERGGLFSGGLSAGPGGGGGVERADGAGIEQPVQRGGAASEVDAGQRALAQTDAGGCGTGVEAAGGACRGGNEERAEEGGEVGVVADDQQVLVAGVLAQQLAELGEGGVGGKRGGGEDFGLVSHLGADERGGLHAALQGAGDDEVELELHGVEDMGKLEAVALAVLVEGALVVEDRVDALYAGAGVTENVEVHRARNIVGQARGASGKGSGKW